MKLERLTERGAVRVAEGEGYRLHGLLPHIEELSRLKEATPNQQGAGGRQAMALEFLRQLVS